MRECVIFSAAAGRAVPRTKLFTQIRPLARTVTAAMSLA